MNAINNTAHGATQPPAQQPDGHVAPTPFKHALRRALLTTSVVLVTALIVAAALGAVAWRALAPMQGDWTHTVRLGPFTRAVSVPVLLRWGTHPLVLPLLNNRRVNTRAGTWLLQTTTGGNLHATCAPCVLRLPALGPAPTTLNSVVLDAMRGEPEAWLGTITLGTHTQSVSSDAPTYPAIVAWQAKLGRHGLQLKASLPPTPVASIIDVMGTAVPEAQTANVQGTFAFEARGVLNAQGLVQWRVKPALDGVVVTGLGTEALATAEPPTQCTRANAINPTRVEGWLPRAVVAAEDQRFFEHPGYDLDEVMSSWTRNQQPGTHTRGASTITQQLAKMVYTGDQRSAARKVREWLYAVEMERTLGKGRILQLYLAIAPWGGNVCGGDMAARRYLRKPSLALAPHEAAWLASLLAAPDAQLARAKQQGRIDHERVARVIEGYRPMPKAQRVLWVGAAKTWEPNLEGALRSRMDLKLTGLGMWQ